MRPGLASRARRGRLAVLLLACCLAGCDSSTTAFSSDHDGSAEAAAAVVTELAGWHDAREVAHTGKRLVELWDRSSQPARYLAYREEVASDGLGRFALAPLAPLTEVAPDWPTFELMQRSRARFLMRYRDFAVRDQALFLRNYTVHDLGRSELVAGRPSSLFRVLRRDGQRSFEVAVDQQSGLFLRVRELDGEGRPTSGFAYESIDLAPDLDAVVFHRSAIEERGHSLGRPLEEVFEAPVLTPRLLPEGYALRGASTLVEDDGRRWAKLSYSDGVETLFFAQTLPEPGEPLREQRPPRADELLVLESTPVVMASGRVGGHELVVAGKVGARALLDLVESSLP